MFEPCTMPSKTNKVPDCVERLVLLLINTVQVEANVRRPLPASCIVPPAMVSVCVAGVASVPPLIVIPFTAFVLLIICNIVLAPFMYTFLAAVTALLLKNALFPVVGAVTVVVPASVLFHAPVAAQTPFSAPA